MGTAQKEVAQANSFSKLFPFHIINISRPQIMEKYPAKTYYS
jgi:hypothetical protein